MLHSKLALLTAALSLVTGAPVASNSISARDTGKSGFVEVGLQKVRHINKNGTTPHKARRSEPSADLDFTGIRYFATFEVGGQTQTAIFDTGSTDTWVYSYKAEGNGYDPRKSSSYHWINDDYTTSYGDGSNSVAGTWGSDTVKLGGATIPNYPFALVNQSTPTGSRGIFGLGPPTAERGTGLSYKVFNERLVDDGVTSSSAFSIYDASNDGSDATLLLGGIDTAKFKAPLYTVPIDKGQPGSGDFYYIVDYTFQGQSYDGGVLDTGTPFFVLPSDLAGNLASAAGAQALGDGTYLFPSKPSNVPSLTVTISGVDVHVPGSDLIYDAGDGSYLYLVADNTLSGGLNILGDPVLKQLYLLFDWDNSKIGFAPVVKTTSSSVVAVSGSNYPESTPAPDQSSASQIWNPLGGLLGGL